MAKTNPRLDELYMKYFWLFTSCEISTDKLPAVNSVVKKLEQNRPRYERVTASLGSVPWWFVGLIHYRESGLSFNNHLHNGDPLSGRTIHVPAGCPHANPRANSQQGPSTTNPYTWEESAEDVMRSKGLNAWTDWSIPAALYKLEEYNGWGYHFHDVNSAYLWSFTNQYAKGKYVADGTWDPNAVDWQLGAAAILRMLVDMGIVAPKGLMNDFADPFEEDMEKIRKISLWLNGNGDVVHPYAPAGGCGPGYSRRCGSLFAEASILPHPLSAAARRLDPSEIPSLFQSRQDRLEGDA